MKKAFFLDSKTKSLSIVPYFLKEVYKKKKYYLLPDNFFIRTLIIFVYTKVLRKFEILISLISKIRIVKFNSSKFRYVIFDNHSLGTIDKILPKKEFYTIATRIEDIKEIFINKFIVFFLIKNFFKNSLKINYIASLIYLIKPEKVITIIDNSFDFHLIYKIFKNESISFYAIQNAYRNEIYLKEILSKSNYSGNYFCFGNYELSSINKNFSQKSKCNVRPIGSLRIELAKEYIDKKYEKKLDEVYDVCLISEASSNIFSSGALNELQYEDCQKNNSQLLQYCIRFCKKHNKRLLFLGRNSINNLDQNAKEEELLYYKFKNENLKFDINFFDKSKYDHIKHLIQSRLILGTASTLLTESFGLKKKILVCHWNNEKIEFDFNSSYFPGNGILKLSSTKYMDFEKRVQEILDLNYDDYLSKVENPNTIYNLNFDTLKFLRKEMLK